MATVDELIEQYKTDPELKEDIDKILEDNKITVQEFFYFTKKYDLKVSVTQLPEIVKKAKQLGFIKVDDKQTTK